MWTIGNLLPDIAALSKNADEPFTADSQSMIVRGRNVGDEHFDAGQNLLFADLDVTAIAPVVKEESRDFDRY